MERNAYKANAGRAWAIFAVCVLGFNLSMFYRVSVTMISPELARDLSLSASQLGDLSAAFFYAFALCQIPLGMALDRLGPRRVMTILGLVGVGSAAMFAMSTSASTAVIARVLMGLGMSCNLMGPLYLISIWFPPTRFATVSGLFMSLGVLGQLGAATPLVYLSQALGWRGAFFAMAALNLVQVAALYLIVRDRQPGVEPPATVRENPLKGLGQVMRMPSYWIISMGNFFRYGCIMSVLGLWGGPYLINALGLSPVQAGNALLCVSLGFMIGQPVAGRLSDSVLKTRKYMIIPSLFTSALLSLLLGWLPQGLAVWAVYAMFFALGLSSAPGQIMFAHIRELAPPHLAARAMTSTNLFLMVGPAAVMQFTGFLVDIEPTAINSPADLWGVWIFLSAGLTAAGVAYMFVPDSSPGKS